MAKRQFQLTEAQVKELTSAYVNCKDGPTRTRYQAVRLYGTGYPVKEVLEITGCSRTSLMDWCRAYRADGPTSLVDKRRGGNRAKLSAAQMDDLRRRLHQYAPANLFGATAATSDGQFWTVEDLYRALQQWYRISYQSRGSYYRLFDLCGFSYHRPARTYKSRSEAKVTEFEEQLEKKTIDIAQEAPQTVFLTEDEAGLYLQATTMAVWYPRGQTPVVRAHPGREHVFFYGTLNLHTGQEIVMRTTEMNSGVTAQYLALILEAFPEQNILLLWDRAPWHFGQPVRDVLAAHPRLEVMLFPVAAPDLNPQEHVWKAARCAVSHNHMTPRLPALADKFESYLKANTFRSSFLDRYGFNSICPMFK